MTTVICFHCEHTVSIDECWCVIDAKEKKRYFECKKPCIFPVKPSPPITAEQQIKDWTEAYPKESWFQRIQSWFSGPSGYIKVKSS